MTQSTVKSALSQTMSNLAANPSAAKVVFRAETKLEEGTRCTALVRDFEPMVVDEPPELGGQDAAMNPVELMLVALGTCQEIMYAAYGAVMDVPLEEVKVNVKGYLDLRGMFAMDEHVPPGYLNVVFETRIKSPADYEAVQRVVQMVESHCPVLDTLQRPIAVRGNVHINGVPLPAMHDAVQPGGEAGRWGAAP